MARKTIWTYVALSAMSHLGVALGAAMYMMYILGEGLDHFTSNLPNLVYFMTIAALEMPTGSIADSFGRKRSFVLSCFLHAAGLFIYAAARNFWGFALAEFVIAMGTTCASGAFKAWLVDELDYHGYKVKQKKLDKIFSAEHFAGHLAAAFGAVVGGILAEKDMALPWIVGGCIALCAGVFSMVMVKEKSFTPEGAFKDQVRQAWPTMKASLGYARGNKTVRLIFALGAVQFLAVQAPNMKWQPFFSQGFGMSMVGLGLVFAGIRIALMAGISIAPWLARRMENERRFFLALQLATAAGIIGAISCSGLPLVLSIFLAHEVARGAFDPILESWLNMNIPSRQRATLISLANVAKFLGGALGLLASGLLAQYVSIKAAWVSFGGFLIVASLFLFLRKKS